MSTLSSSNPYLESLIDSGADAQSNLFKASFTSSAESNSKGKFLENYDVRLQGISIPSLEVGTIDFPYLNTSIKKELPSHTLEKTLSLKFRVDENFNLYNQLLSSLKVDFRGRIVDMTPSWSISVYSVKIKPSEDSITNISNPYLGDDYLDYLDSLGEEIPSTSENSTELFCRKWIFQGCKLVKLDSLNFEYSNSSPLSINCTFIYSNLLFK